MKSSWKKRQIILTILLFVFWAIAATQKVAINGINLGAVGLLIVIALNVWTLWVNVRNYRAK